MALYGYPGYEMPRVCNETWEFQGGILAGPISEYGGEAPNIPLHLPQTPLIGGLGPQQLCLLRFVQAPAICQARLCPTDACKWTGRAQHPAQAPQAASATAAHEAI